MNDSHCHLNDEKLYPNWEKIVSDAVAAGVNSLLCVGWDLESSVSATKIAKASPYVFAAIGFHPENLDGICDDFLKKIMTLAASKRVLAIGEIGFDFHWFKEKEDQAKQEEWFVKQIEMANALGLPVSIHARDASEATYEVLKNHPVKRGASLHCYSGSREMMERFLALDKNIYIGFDGPVTYKNSRILKENARACPIDRILVETDSPYLPPAPLRGQKNTPASIPLIVREIAQIRGTSAEEIENATDENFERLFKRRQ